MSLDMRVRSEVDDARTNNVHVFFNLVLHLQVVRFCKHNTGHILNGYQINEHIFQLNNDKLVPWMHSFESQISWNLILHILPFLNSA